MTAHDDPTGADRAPSAAPTGDDRAPHALTDDDLSHFRRRAIGIYGGFTSAPLPPVHMDRDRAADLYCEGTDI